MPASTPLNSKGLPASPRCRFTVSPRKSEAELSMAGQSDQPKPIGLFYSYSHKDEDLRRKLETHLAALRRGGLIAEWRDRKLEPGDAGRDEIDRHLTSADSVLLLVSADFMDSDYCWGEEMTRALPWCPELVVVRAGSFVMGSPKNEERRSPDEGPQHRVTFTSLCCIREISPNCRGLGESPLDSVRHEQRLDRGRNDPRVRPVAV
jgi:TIR domain